MRTVVQLSVPIYGLAQDRGRIAWFRGPEWHPRAEILELATGRRIRLPARRPRPQGGIVWPMPALALAGNRVVYVLGAAWGNTGLAYSIISASAGAKRERGLYSDESMSRPTVSERFPWPMAADGNQVVFAAGERLRRLSGARTSPLTGPRRDMISLVRNRYATAWIKTFGGCICNVAPSWSPDGKRLVYSSGLRLGQQNANWKFPRGIHVVGADGTGNRLIARGVNPDWSPDGALIAYERQVGASAIYVVRPDGTGSRRLFPGNDPDWSPDGERIAFTRNFNIFIADKDGSDVRRVATGGTAPDWSPDGQQLAYAGSGGGIYVIRVGGSRKTKLAGAADYASSPRWLPGGRKVAFDVISGDEFTETVYGTRVGLANADGRPGKEWLELPRNSLTPAWSPDGRRIAYAGWLSERHPARDIPSTEIFTAAVDRQEARRVTTTPAAEPTSRGIVRSLAGDRRLTQLAATGAVRAVAISPQFAAMLVKGFFGKRLEILHPRTGRLLRRIAVPPDTAPKISSSGTRLVMAAGTRVLLVDGRTEQISVLAQNSVAPRGLSIEGRRVAWFENVRGSGRVRALTLAK